MSLFLHYLSLPYLLEGIELTLQVTALGLAGGLVLGLILAWMQLSRLALLKKWGLDPNNLKEPGLLTVK